MLTTRAFILRSVDYGESDRILTLYTREAGRISAMARAARKSRKRYGGALEPFSEFEAVLSPSRLGALRQISEASLINSHFELCSDYSRMETAARMFGWIRDATHEEEPDPPLFDLLVHALSLIDQKTSQNTDLTEISFGLRVMARCGFSLSVIGCNACGRPVPEGRSAYFDPSRGGLVCTACGGGPLLLSAEVVDGFQQLSRSDLDRVSLLELSPDAISVIKKTFDAFLRHQLPTLATREIRPR